MNDGAKAFAGESSDEPFTSDAAISVPHIAHGFANKILSHAVAVKRRIPAECPSRRVASS